MVPAKAKRRLFGPIPQDLKPTLEYTVVVSPGCLSVPACQTGRHEQFALDGAALFPYQRGVEALSRGRWPDATRDESGCLLEIKFLNRPELLRRGKPGISRLYLEIRDYPGEWLLDLPLLAMDYRTWCAQCHSLFNRAMCLSIGRSFIEKLKSIDPFATLSELELQVLWQEQLTFLKACQQAGLTMIQPGRWLHALPSGDESKLPFIKQLPNHTGHH